MARPLRFGLSGVPLPLQQLAPRLAPPPFRPQGTVSQLIQRGQRPRGGFGVATRISPAPRGSEALPSQAPDFSQLLASLGLGGGTDRFNRLIPPTPRPAGGMVPGGPAGEPFPAEMGPTLSSLGQAPGETSPTRPLQSLLQAPRGIEEPQGIRGGTGDRNAAQVLATLRRALGLTGLVAARAAGPAFQALSPALGGISGLLRLAGPGESLPSRISGGLSAAGGAARLATQLVPSLATTLGPAAAAANVGGLVAALAPIIHAFAGGNREAKAAKSEQQTFEARSRVLKQGFQGFPGFDASPEALATWFKQTLPFPVLIEIGGGKGVSEAAWASSNESATRLAQLVAGTYEHLQTTRPDLIRSMQIPGQAADILVDWVMAARGHRAGEGVRIPLADISEFGSERTQLAGALGFIPDLPDLSTAPSLSALLGASRARLREQRAVNELPPSIFDAGVQGARLAPSAVFGGLRHLQGIPTTEERPALPPELEAWLASQLAVGFGEYEPISQYRAALQNTSQSSFGSGASY